MAKNNDNDDENGKDNDKEKKPRKKKKGSRARKTNRAKNTKSKKSSQLKSYYTAPLIPIPTLNLESEGVDQLLSKLIRIVYITLIDIEKIPAKSIRVEEYRKDTAFLYLFENKKDGITGHIARAADGHIKFLAMDKARFKWAVDEGFIPNAIDLSHRQFVYDKIGVLRELATLMDFIKFMAGKKDYVFTGVYLLTERKEDKT